MIRYYTYKNQVPLQPGDKIGFRRGKGYYRIIATLPPRNLSQYVNFAAQEPLAGLGAPSKYANALSADKEYRYDNLADIVAQLKKHGRVPGWCDCEATPAAEGIAFVKQYDLSYFIGQAEKPSQFDNAMSVGAKVLIGNITALRQDQIDKMRVDRIEFIQEDYWNEGWGRADHPLISAYCAGIYPTALWAPQPLNYRQAGRWREGDGVYLTANVQDWTQLP